MRSYITCVILIACYCVKCKRIAYTENYQMNVGTTLFAQLDTSKKCWSQDDVALLSTRRSFQSLLPAEDAVDITNEEFIYNTYEYFLLILDNIKKSCAGRTKHVLLLAFADTLGGYLNHFLLPVARYSYYCGFISYDSVQQLYDLFDELKVFLKTTGTGWSPPGKNFKVYRNIKIPAYIVNECKCTDPCSNIIFYDGQSGPIIPLPYFDSNENPVAIAVPLLNAPMVNVESRQGVLVLVRYYKTAVQCLKSKGNESSAVFFTFKQQFRDFLQNDVVPKLSDDKFYSVFGGVYRILKALQVPCASVPFINEQVSPSLEKNRVLDRVSGFVLLVVAVAILVWLCIGLAYCCVCCRIFGKPKQKKDYIRITCSTDPSTDAKTDGGYSESTEKRNSKLSIEKIKNQFRNVCAPSTDSDSRTIKPLFCKSAVKKVCIQNDGRPTVVSYPKSSVQHGVAGTCTRPEESLNSSASSASTNSGLSYALTKSSKSSIDYFNLPTALKSALKSSTSMKTNTTEISSVDRINIPACCENMRSTTSNKSGETVSLECYNNTAYDPPKNYPIVPIPPENCYPCDDNTKNPYPEAGTSKSPYLILSKTYEKCNIEATKSSPRTSTSLENVCNAEGSNLVMNVNQLPNKLPAFKYNFKYDLEETTSSSESSPRDPIWPHLVPNTAQTCRMKEKHRKSGPSKRSSHK